MAKRKIAKLIAGEVDKLGVAKSLGDEYLGKVEAAAAKKPRKKRKRKSSSLPSSEIKPPKQPKQPQADVNIDDYVKRLEDAGTDENKFYEVFNEIKSKGLSKKQLNDLASKYTRLDPKIMASNNKTPEDKLRQLEMRMRDKEATEVYGRIIRTTNPWQ